MVYHSWMKLVIWLPMGSYLSWYFLMVPIGPCISKVGSKLSLLGAHMPHKFLKHFGLKSSFASKNFIMVPERSLLAIKLIEWMVCRHLWLEIVLMSEDGTLLVLTGSIWIQIALMGTDFMVTNGFLLLFSLVQRQHQIQKHWLGPKLTLKLAFNPQNLHLYQIYLACTNHNPPKTFKAVLIKLEA